MEWGNDTVLYGVIIDDDPRRRKELFMKTIRSFFNLLLFFPAAGFFFAGCYTHMETMRDEGSGGGDGDDYAYTDSTNASNDTTGANYFSDDDYRESN